MFKRKPNPEVEELNRAITHVHSQFGDYPAESEEFKEMTERLATLYAQKATMPTNRFSKDQIVIASTNLLGILVIVGYEQRGVVTSKALGFIGKATR